jgi:hypothetical protein
MHIHSLNARFQTLIASRVSVTFLFDPTEAFSVPF